MGLQNRETPKVRKLEKRSFPFDFSRSLNSFAKLCGPLPLCVENLLQGEPTTCPTPTPTSPR